MKIGETILKLREEKKMSQEEFAQYYHVTRQTISNWEKEKNYPDLQTLVKISDESKFRWILCLRITSLGYKKS